MAWAITIGGKSVELTDLTMEKVQAIADEEGVYWWDVLNQYPAKSLTRFRALVDACAEYAGVPSPAGEIVTAQDFIDKTEGDGGWITEATDIEDKPMMDGFPQTPGEQESGSSSTSPGDTDGPPTSSDANESPTS